MLSLTAGSTHLLGGWFLVFSAMIADFQISLIGGANRNLLNILGIFQPWAILHLVILRSGLGDPNHFGRH